MLDVYFDLGNIAGYLALQPTCELLQNRQVEMRWQPIKGIVPRPLSREPRQSADDELSQYKHKRWQAKRNLEQAELVRDCARLGIPIEQGAKQFDATLTHLAWLNLKKAGIDPLGFITRVYEARFVEGNDLESEASVVALVRDFGLTDCDFNPQLMADHEANYLALGIHDSPSFVLDGETFQGRQHFPLIAWRLDGEPGQPPV